MATNYSNAILDPYVSIDTAPDRYQTKTGTILTSGVYVTGSNTLFTTEIFGDSGIGSPTKVTGGYLFNGTNEVRRIVAVNDDTHLVLDAGFTVNFGGNVLFVPESHTMQLSWVCRATGGKVDGVSLVVNEFGGWGYEASVPSRTISPIIIDGSSGQIDVSKFLGN